MITQFQFNELLKAIGVAEVFVGDPFVADGMAPLGATEGEIRGELTYTENRLTAPERTGDIAHQTQVQLATANIIVPIVLGDPDLWDKISPTGAKGGGSSAFEPVQEMSVLVIPKSELSASGTLAYPVGGPWAPAAPVNALWLWRAYPVPGNIPYRFQDGGKVITEVRFNGMFFPDNPEGQKVFTIGDPLTQGIADVLI
jgi:hypothetical protein